MDLETPPEERKHRDQQSRPDAAVPSALAQRAVRRRHRTPAGFRITPKGKPDEAARANPRRLPSFYSYIWASQRIGARSPKPNKCGFDSCRPCDTHTFEWTGPLTLTTPQWKTTKRCVLVEHARRRAARSVPAHQPFAPGTTRGHAPGAATHGAPGAHGPVAPTAEQLPCKEKVARFESGRVHKNAAWCPSETASSDQHRRVMRVPAPLAFSRRGPGLCPRLGPVAHRAEHRAGSAKAAGSSPAGSTGDASARPDVRVAARHPA